MLQLKCRFISCKNKFLFEPLKSLTFPLCQSTFVHIYIYIHTHIYICNEYKILYVTRISFFFFCLFAFSRATPVAYGGSQIRGLIGAVATGLCHSHSNVGSEPLLWPTPQLTATPGPQPTEWGQGSNPHPHRS